MIAGPPNHAPHRTAACLVAAVAVALGREPQRRRRGIFVEPRPHWIPQLRRSGLFLMMSPLTGLGMAIGVGLLLPACRVRDSRVAVAPGSEPQRRRRGIFVEPRPQWIPQLRRSGLFLMMCP